MIKNLGLLLFFLLIVLSLSSCQKTLVTQNTCQPPKTSEKKISKKKIHNFDRELEKLLAKTDDIGKYEAKIESSL